MKPQTSLFFSLFLVLSVQLSGQDRLMYSHFGQGIIQSLRTDGTDVQPFIEVSGNAPGIKVDQVNEMVYWVNSSGDLLLRTDFSRTQIDTLLSDLDRPSQVEVDPYNEKVYVADSGLDQIISLDLDGENVQVVHEETSFNPMALFVDPDDQRLYFSRQSGIIGVIDLLTAEITTITTVAGGPTEIEVDIEMGKIYFVNQILNNSSVQRCNLDGTDLETLYEDGIMIYGLAVDFANEIIYWTDWGGDFPKFLWKSDLDGADASVLREFPGTVPYSLDLIQGLVVDIDAFKEHENIQLNVFPNPTVDYVSIQSAGIIQEVSVFHISGQFIGQYPLVNDRIDLSALPQGNYLLAIQTDQGQAIQSVLKW